jgi:hypothetical protein
MRFRCALALCWRFRRWWPVSLFLAPRPGRGQVAIGPLFRELAGLAEDDRHHGVSHLQLGQHVGYDGGPDVREPEDAGVPVFHGNGSPRQGGEFGEREPEPAAAERADQIGEALAFNRGKQVTVVGLDRVVAAGQAAANSRYFFSANL